MSGVPTEAEFRACGVTINALKFPLSDSGVAWLAKFNGVAPEQLPRAGRYAPNWAMMNYVELKAREESK